MKNVKVLEMRKKKYKTWKSQKNMANFVEYQKAKAIARKTKKEGGFKKIH